MVGYYRCRQVEDKLRLYWCLKPKLARADNGRQRNNRYYKSTTTTYYWFKRIVICMYGIVSIIVFYDMIVVWTHVRYLYSHSVRIKVVDDLTASFVLVCFLFVFAYSYMYMSGISFVIAVTTMISDGTHLWQGCFVSTAGCGNYYCSGAPPDLLRLCWFPLYVRVTLNVCWVTLKYCASIAYCSSWCCCVVVFIL